MPKFTVKYYAGTYNGTRTVTADDDDHAIAMVRAYVRSLMTEPMYSDGYKVIDQEDDEPAGE